MIGRLLLGGAALTVCLTLGHAATAGAASAPTVVIAPGPSGSGFKDAQNVRVSVGPNALLVPRSHGGHRGVHRSGRSAANLPTSLLTCDENTLQGDTTVVQADGSFVENDYTLYSLPSRAAGRAGQLAAGLRTEGPVRPVRR